ncbi:MAG: POTRA domain-containing protein [Halarcobacter ebronensis]
MGLEKGNMYSAKRARNAKEILLKELEKEGYINSIVEAEVEPITEGSVSLTFNVNKGDEIVIKNVNYVGAKNLDTGDFEKVTANKEKELSHHGLAPKWW